MKKISLLAIGLLSLSLQGCIFIAGAAAGAAAIAIVYDKRNVESVLQDQRIDRQVMDRLKDNTELYQNIHVNVTSFGQVVLLTGEAPTAEMRQEVEKTAWTVSGIKRIFNAIAIQGPTSTLTHASDSWITTKIKTEMLATKGLKSASIKVVTENGTVYLLGTLTREQETMVVDIARHTAGVQKVVKIFQYTLKKADEEADEGDENPKVETAQVDSTSAVTTHPVEEAAALAKLNEGGNKASSGEDERPMIGDNS